MSARDAARAIDALRRGWAVTVRAEDGALRLMAIEGADAVTTKDFDPVGEADILISAARAQTLKLANQIAAADPDMPVLIARAPWIDNDAAMAIADPVRDLASPLKGPFLAKALAAPAAAKAALRLARLAGILPAFFVTGEGACEGEASAQDIAAYDDAAHLAIATRARLPVSAAENAEIVAFRSPDEPREHVALVVGRRNAAPPVVRLHSECLTGDVLGSLKCDCGPQLHQALHQIADAQWGVLLYLRQEGRGIGLVNKLRAYALQDQGFDTVDANVRLGFAVDARDFSVAARMLDLLGIGAVRLLTNNPGKVAGLEAAGIEVVERLPIILPANPHNERYLATKRDRTGHQL
ncbi:GTP cyclohydrolase II [Sphingobium wenxiniae]|uniref:GTP cyclohydrolase-2 n=2 Tax=Sphingobium TaxID=165695 RepID=T0HRA0_9SPHN|nr:MULTISPECIES: GTP cyclohydrolase II [Sphingobium]EQB00084.1 GTP cyclohydrolase [Sphingobium baderi LL03]KMS62109.1 GTP cyclohydrolase [Sphingobium baderi LL03]MBB6192410.1 GTP cyclohydrolase II [Sphingobium wenxiniae]TWH91780.1 GTP cyclohydrolase II [Sphingobium wenxiniae]